MPVYEYLCPQCHERFEQYRSVEEHAKRGFCPKCMKMSPRIVVPQRVYINTGKGDRFGTVCHSFEKPVVVRNKHHMRELCKQHDCIPYGLD